MKPTPTTLSLIPLQREREMDVTFRIPEIWSERKSDDIIDDLLLQIAEAGLAEHVVGIQRYRHSIEVQVTPQEVTRFLNMDVYVDGMQLLIYFLVVGASMPN